MSRSHVDIYFPHPAVAAAELELLPRTLPQSVSHHPIDGHGSSAPGAAGARRRERGDPVAPPSRETFHASYHTLDEIHDFVRDLADTYPQQVTVVPLGHSGEGREMFALEITAGASSSRVSHDPKSQVVLSKKGNPKGAKPPCGFLITGAQHAREVSFIFMIGTNREIQLSVALSLPYLYCSGLPPLPRCISRMLSSLIHPRNFLSPVCSIIMYVCYHLGEERPVLIRDRTSTSFLCQIQMDTCTLGKSTDSGESLWCVLSLCSSNSLFAGTKIACSLVLKPNASVLT